MTSFYKCDGCGRHLKKHELRYRVKIEISAIYEQNEIHLSDIIQNHQKEIIQLIQKMENMNPEELEEQIYKSFEFDFCPSCYRVYIKNPLKFKVENYSGNETDSLSKETEKFLNSLLFNRKDEK